MDEYEQFRQWFCELKDRRNNRHMDEPDFDRAVWEHIARHTAHQVLMGQITSVDFCLDSAKAEWSAGEAIAAIENHLTELQSELARLEGGDRERKT